MTPDDAAARLGCSAAWVRQLCKDKRIKARKTGRDWKISAKDLPATLADIPHKPTGRPRKED